MSLVVTNQLKDLTDDIYALLSTPVEIAGKSKAEIETLTKERIQAHMKLICEYIVAYTEVTASENFAAGFGDNHVPPSALDLTAGVYPVSGSVIGKGTVE